MLTWLERVLDKLARLGCVEVRVPSDNGELKTVLLVSGVAGMDVGIVLIDECPANADIPAMASPEPTSRRQSQPLLVAGA